MVYSLTLPEEGNSESVILHKVAEWNHNYFVVTLASRNNTLMLGDAISSISFIELDGNQLKVIARDYGSLWPVCIDAWDDRSVIGANVSQASKLRVIDDLTVIRVTTISLRLHWSERSSKQH